MAKSSTALSSRSSTFAEPFLVVEYESRCEIIQLKRRKPTCIGRSGDCEVVISHEKSSRRHCEVFYRNRKWYVRDLESRNGTRLNGVKITGEALLRHGDLLDVAKTRIVFTNDLADAKASLSSFSSDLFVSDTAVSEREQPTKTEVPALKEPVADDSRQISDRG